MRLSVNKRTAIGFIFALAALNKVTKLEKKLKESGVLQEDWDKES